MSNVKTPDLYTGEPPLQSAHNTWKQVKTDLAYALGPNVHRSWTGRLHITQADESVVTLSAPTRFVASKIETQYADTVRRLWDKPIPINVCALFQPKISSPPLSPLYAVRADRHPDKIEKATERLKSYMSSGLVCKIGAADYELRLRILDRLIARRRAGGQQDLAIPQNARDHLAARMNATPRDLEGAFNQIVAQSEFLGTSITLESVQETLSDSRYMMGQRLTVDRIQRAVCEVFSVTPTDMVSKRRARVIARPRQVAMYLCKRLTKRSLPDIGRRFGGRDHTTVMHAVKRIDQLRADDASFNAQIEAVETLLKA